MLGVVDDLTMNDERMSRNLDIQGCSGVSTCDVASSYHVYLPARTMEGRKALSVYLSLRGTVLHAKELIKVPDQSWDHCRTCSTKLYVQFCKHLEVWFRLKLNSKQPCCLIGSQECIRTGN